jgi:hypothetical protein
MTDYRGQIAGAVAATVFRSPTCFSWFDQQPFEIPRWILDAFSPEEVRHLLLLILQSQLYNDFYCLGFAAPPTYFAHVPGIEAASFVKKLDAANRGKGYSESGMWRIKKLRKNEIIVKRDGLELVVQPRHFLTGQKSLEPRTIRTLRSPQGLLGISPGFYLAVGNTEWSPEEAKKLNRFYWNLTAAGAATFLRAATSTLNAANLPFRVKVANHPSRFNRCDSGVLYLPMADYGLAGRVLGTIYRAVTSCLKQGTPALTKVLVPGLGWAEDPLDENSFGMHRCRLIADGMLRACELGKNTLQSRLEVVESCFKEAGITLEEPFLNPGSRARHAFDRFAEHALGSSLARWSSCRSDSHNRNFHETAHRIGLRVTRDALWHDVRCSWFGAEMPSRDPERAADQPAYKVLGPDLYSGTSGVALFLAELYKTSGDAEVRRTAIGAIHHSISCADTIAPGSRLSLYKGLTGIALATVRVGIASGREELLDRASALLKRMMHQVRAIDANGFVSGKAGAIVGFLLLWRVLHDPMLLETAARLGDGLLKGAEKSNRGISWRSASMRGYSNSIGFSEGIAGIAYALLELFCVTGDAAYRRTAEQALVYQSKRLSAQAHSPRAFRIKRGSLRRTAGASSTETSWSHGSPGIALSRIQAFEILKNVSYKAEAIGAIRTARQTLENWRRVGRGNFSLAHGLPGNAEVLLYAREVLGEELEAEYTLAVQAAREAGINCTVLGCNSHWGAAGETPCLMSGLAGIGYFYLRLRDPAMLSTLTWKQGDFDYRLGARHG